MADLGDGRDVAEEPEVAELPLLRAPRWIVEGGLGRPAHLLLDVLDELLDLWAAAAAFSRSMPDERRLRFLVGEVEVDRAADQQDATDETREDDDVLPEQPAARPVPHRCSLSARRRIRRGTVSSEEGRRLQIDREVDLVGALDGQILGPCSSENLGDQPRRLDALCVIVWP